MAKTNQVNPFEQHIEKIVLGISALLLIYALIHWVSSSPRTFEISGKTVAPGLMDNEIKNLASLAKSTVENAQPKSVPIVDDSRQLADRQDNPLGSGIGQMSAGGQFAPAEDIGASEQSVALADIRKAIVKLQTPRARVESEYPYKEGQQPQDVLVAHVASVAAWKQMEDDFRKKNVGMPVVAAVEAQVRERLADGSWSEPRAVKMVAMPADQNNGNKQQSAPPVVPDYDQNNAEAVHAAIGELDAWKDYILQPPYWQIWWPNNQWGDWTINLPVTSVSEAEKAAIKAAEEEAKPQAQPARDQSTKKTTSARNSRNSGPGGPGGKGRPGRSSFADDMLGGPRGNVLEGIRPPAGMRPDKPTRSTRTPNTPEVTAKTTEEAEIPAPEPTPMPDLKTQLENGQVVVWFHDESLEGLKVYQYRMRLVVANPLVTSTDVKDPQDAIPGVVAGEWSDWSSPVSIPRPTQFFVTGHLDGTASNSSSYIRITVFSRVLGQWVKQVFGRVNEGDLVGSKIEAKVTDPNTGEPVKSKADFTTGAIMVHFDFRKVSSRNSKIDTVEVLYLDDKGNLRTRIREMDETGEIYKQRNAEAKPVGSAS